MAAPPLGTGRCPIGCGSTKAAYSLSKSKLAVGVCNSCNSQVFSRSGRSDELLRANILQPAGAPAEELGPIAETGEAGQPPAPPPAPTAPPSKPRTFAWGFLAGREV